MTELTIRKLVRAVVDEARALVLDLEARGRFISKHYRYPRMAAFEGGLPNVRYEASPPDWSGPFKYRGGGDYEIAYDQVTSLPALVEHVLSTVRLAERILLPGTSGDDETRRRFDEISVALLPLKLLDRLMLRHGTDFDDVAFKGEWRPLERWLESDRPLPVDVVVPLALVKCERDVVQLGEEARLVSLADDEQRARVPETVWGAATDPCVLAAATHALVFEGRHLDQGNRWLAHTAVPGASTQLRSTGFFRRCSLQQECVRLRPDVSATGRLGVGL